MTYSLHQQTVCCIRYFAAWMVIGLAVHAEFAGRPASAQEPSATQPATEEAAASDNSDTQKASAPKKSSDKSEKTAWVSLIGHWKACEFGGEGDVEIKAGLISMQYGDPLTGVRWEGPFAGGKTNDAAAVPFQTLPRDNYELRWECQRTKGFDFLCAFTFPVADQHASLVMGGWGGGITGISSIDGQDASDNNTTMFKSYEDNKWYSARVRVETEKITVWVDGTELFSHDRKDHRFDIRFEMDPCTPLGIANFECDSQIRNIQIRPLHPVEIAAAAKDGE